MNKNKSTKNNKDLRFLLCVDPTDRKNFAALAKRLNCSKSAAIRRAVVFSLSRLPEKLPKVTK